jgi:anti-sigma28 factor (negative regulator of flagellin synthesis)
MDVKQKPPVTVTDRTNLKALESVRNQTKAENVGGASTSTEAPKTRKQVDTSTTSNLVELGKREAQRLHEQMMQQLAEDISDGSYNADVNVVAARVAEVLGDG